MVIPVRTSVGQYDIVLEKGALSRLSALWNLDRKVFIVTDSGVPELYAKTAASQCRESFVVTIEQGEQSKSFENYRMLLEKMVAFGMTRTDCVMAVGGGVVGDLSGFAAAGYMRGVDFYNLPTTVLSQVDSSIGGKVAVDFCGYKNLVGAFYPPKGVVIDSDTLNTLPQRQIANGLAEAVKMALTGDEELFRLFEEQPVAGHIETVLQKALMIKKQVVEEDEKETGLRKVLNFGHTLGHAIESQNGLTELYHGECVALGMIPMCSPKTAERLIRVLEKLGLPTEFSYDPEKLFKAVSHDKKAQGDKITLIYVENPGSFLMKEMSITEYVNQLKGVLRP